MRPTRRSVLAGTLATFASLGMPALAGPDRPRLLLVLLRGGADGLALVPAPGDPHWRRARGPLAPDRTAMHPLDGTFALHPALGPLLPWWRDGSLAVVHAVGTPGGARSHFDAQDILDNGREAARATRTGWLNRALPSLRAEAGDALALGDQLPLVLRGPAEARSLDPFRELDLDEPLLAELSRLYARDPQLLRALEAGLDTRRRLEGHPLPRARRLNRASGRLVGGLLADGPTVGVLEVAGWDTHTRQGPQLERLLGDLANGLLGVRDGLGAAWADTTVVVVSEFGRTVAGNGTGGTDHGTGGVALLAGGGVAGGRVHGRWPGLSDLHEGRDLRATTDVRSVFGAVLAGPFGLTSLTDVFPGGPASLDGLFHA